MSGQLGSLLSLSHHPSERCLTQKKIAPPRVSGLPGIPRDLGLPGTPFPNCKPVLDPFRQTLI